MSKIEFGAPGLILPKPRGKIITYYEPDLVMVRDGGIQVVDASATQNPIEAQVVASPLGKALLDVATQISQKIKPRAPHQATLATVALLERRLRDSRIGEDRLSDLLEELNTPQPGTNFVEKGLRLGDAGALRASEFFSHVHRPGTNFQVDSRTATELAKTGYARAAHANKKGRGRIGEPLPLDIAAITLSNIDDVMRILAGVKYQSQTSANIHGLGILSS